MSHDSVPAPALEATSDEVTRTRAERLRRFHVSRVPPLRAVGLPVALVFAWLHNLYLRPDLDLDGALRWVTGITLAYSWLGWMPLRWGYDRVERINLGHVYLCLDVLIILGFIYATGTERSQLFFLLLIRTADQTAAGSRASGFFTALSAAGYGLMMIVVDLLGTHTVSWPLGIAKLAIILGLGLYLLGVARTVDYYRNRTTQAVHSARSLLADLRLKSEELRREKIKAQQASLAKSHFLANMSHEIRTPMNAIIGINRLMLRTELSSEAKRYGRIVGSAADNLLHLINGILDLSKVEAGQLELELISFSLPQLLEEIAALSGSQARDKGIPITFDISDELSTWVVGDPTRVRQVLINLISNAVKFTHEGFVKIEARPLAGDRVRFQVIDTGIGISPEFRDRLFDPFSQADASTSRHYGGTGLGLAISRRLVQAMNGELQLKSELGKGSTFTVELSLPPGRPQPSSRSGTVALPRTTPAYQAQVLVADDNEINRMLTESELEDFGLQVTTVCDGHEALELLKERSFDLLFLDCQMPGIDGYETARRIREREAGRRRMPIVALTAQAMKGDRERCLEAGMDDYVTKPFCRHELLEVLSCYLSGLAKTAPPSEESQNVK